MKNPSERFDAWLFGTAACLVYLGTYSFFYNFDGVACAIAVDLDDLRHLVHGNHLAYGLAGWAFCRLWRLLGYAGPGIVLLQVFSSACGGAAAGVFQRSCRNLGLSRWVSLAAAAGLASSYAYWFWSLESQVYMLGALFLGLTAGEALGDGPRPARLGLFHALAFLGHVEHLMFAPVVLMLLRRGRARYACVFAGTVLAAYAAAALFIIRPHSLDDWRLWLLGSAALTPARSFHWHGSYSWRSLADWALTTGRIFTGLDSGRAGACLAAAALAAALWGARAMGPRSKAVLVWLVCYAALIISWEPSTIVYRITDLMAFWLLIAFAVQGLPGRAAPIALSGYVLASAVFNWRHSIAPNCDPRRNAPYQEALWVGRVTPPDAWVAVSNIDHVYIPYFAYRKPLQWAGGDLTRRRVEGREPVFITAEALRTPEWALLFKDYPLEASDRNGASVLFRVKPKAR